MPRYIRARYSGTRLYLGYHNIHTGLKQWDSSWSQASLSPNHWNALYRRRGSPVMSWIFIGAGQPLQHGEVRDSNLAWVGSVVLILVCHYRNVWNPLQWRLNGRDSVSNHQPHDCFLNRLFRRRSKKTSKLRITVLCVENSAGTGEFPAQMASYAENVSIWWRHYDYDSFRISLICHLGYHCCPADLLSEQFGSTDDSNINFDCSVKPASNDFAYFFSTFPNLTLSDVPHLYRQLLNEQYLSDLCRMCNLEANLWKMWTGDHRILTYIFKWERLNTAGHSHPGSIGHWVAPLYND